MGSDSEVQVQFKAVVSDFLNGLREATDSVKESTEGMTGDIGSLAETINKMGSAAVVLAGVGLAFEGIKAAVEYVSDAMEETDKLAEAFKNLGYETGATVPQMNEYTAAIERSGGNVDELTGLMVGMQRGIKANSENLIANGVAANKAALEGMTFEQYLQRVSEIADTAASPTEREQFLITALGRAGATAGPQLKEFVENLEKVRDTQILTSENMAQMEGMEQATGRLKAAQQALQAVISDEVTPFKIAMKNMEAAQVEYQVASVNATNLIKHGFIEAQGSIDKFTGDFIEDMDANIAKAKEWTKSLNEGIRTAKDSMDAGAHFKGKGDKDAKSLTQPDKDKKGNGPMAGWEQELEDMKAKLKVADGDLAEISAADERAFWAKKVALCKQGTKEWDAAVMKMADAGKQVNAEQAKDLKEGSRQAMEVYSWEQQYLRNQAKEKEDLAKQVETEEIDAAKDGLEKKRALLDQEVAMGKKTHAQELEELKKITQEEAKIEIDAITKRQKNYAKDSLEYRKMEEQKLQISRKATNDINAYDDRKLKERLAKYRAFYRSIGHDFGSTFTQMIKEGQSFGQFWNNLMGSLEDTGLQMLSDFISQWIEDHMMALVSSKTTATSEIAGNAGVAATAAMASAAAIPMVGWAMAPGVGAETFAAAMGYMGSIASAALGFDIPEGVNPITQLHEREMVLPADLADGVRNMTGKGGGDGLHVHVHTLDAKSFHGYLRDNKTALVKTLKEIHRDGRKS
jgi:hypothetical protein